MTVIQLLTAQPEKYHLDNIPLRQNPLLPVFFCSKTSHRILMNTAPLLCNYELYYHIYNIGVNGLCRLMQITYKLSFKTFHFAYGNLISHLVYDFILTYLFLIFPALNSAPYSHMLAYGKFACKSGISAPAYTWYVI